MILYELEEFDPATEAWSQTGLLYPTCAFPGKLWTFDGRFYRSGDEPIEARWVPSRLHVLLASSQSPSLSRRR